MPMYSSSAANRNSITHSRRYSASTLPDSAPSVVAISRNIPSRRFVMCCSTYDEPPALLVAITETRLAHRDLHRQLEKQYQRRDNEDPAAYTEQRSEESSEHRRREHCPHEMR